MKNLIYLLILLSCISSAVAQTIFIANSNTGATGGTNVFTGANAINSALAAASNGDIIYVVPSSVNYSTPTLNGKGVTLIGGGFNPDKPGGALSRLNGFYGNASNFKVSGLVFNNELNIPGIFSNIMIEKCRIGYITDGSGGSAKGNMIIQNCIIGEVTQSGGSSILFGNGSSGVRLSNNIIYCHSPTQYTMTALNGAIIENNIFVGSTNGGSLVVFRDVTNCDIKNNIFYGIRPDGSGTFTGNTFQNNLSFGASDNTFPTTNGNGSVNGIEGQDPLFVNFPFGTSYSFDYNADLQSGSPAELSGVGGIDMGAFGGPTPFDPFGTSLPIVQSIIVPATLTQGTDMTVRIQAKGN